MNKIIIIGGGISGLSAGIYAQKYGFESVVYEKNSFLGGECTAWTKKGYHIDACIHWLTGTKEGNALNSMWNDIGVLGDVGIQRLKTFATVNYDGIIVKLYRDINKIKKHFLEIAPEDEGEIIKFCRYIKAFANFHMPSNKPFEHMSILEIFSFFISMIGPGKYLKDLSKITIGEYVKRFKNPALRIAIQSKFPSNLSAHTLIVILAAFISGNADIPVGGSRAMAKRMEDKYKSLGGKVSLNKEVTEIIVKDNSAKGVIFKDGEEVYSNYIIPACDLNITMKKLLKDKYKVPEFEEKFKNTDKYPIYSALFIALGVDADLSSYSPNYYFKTDKYDFENYQKEIITMKHYCYEASFAPKGKSVVTIPIIANYQWWKNKYKNIDVYREEKKRLAYTIIDRIEKHIPMLKDKIELLDIATPMTYERYFSAYRGSWMSFGITPESKRFRNNGKIEGLKNLYLAGQWLFSPGGLSGAAVSGKFAIQRLCKEIKIKI
ncbi:phytoene desaturase family protein [Natronospora cellulosivora (SeqCode)]